jgi:glycosyltransferase involved in cell wall biosynthesis
VGRLVPENGVHLLLEAYLQVDTALRLVIVGDAPFSEAYKKRLRSLADSRVIFTGYAFGRDYEELSSHAYAAVQPSAIEGTRPAVLDQLGFGNCVIARGAAANREVKGDAGILCAVEPAVESLRAALDAAARDPDRVAAIRPLARERISGFYNWEWIADFYEELFLRIVRGEAPLDFNVFVEGRTRA